MGWAGFQELYRRKDRFDIRLLARDSKKNHKKLDRYAGDPAVKVIWEISPGMKMCSEVSLVRTMCFMLVEWCLQQQIIIRKRPSR